MPDLRHPGGVTPIRIGAGALDGSAELLAPLLGGRTLFVVSSAPILALHRQRLEPAIASAGRTVVLEVPDGEAAKEIEVAAGLWRRMMAEGGKRDSRLLAFGGGSVGDLGGFVAGCFLRGIPYVQVPTTLLAQVDASVGGKTAVDLPEGKNTVGLFHHPRAVVADTALLGTLAPGELRSGLVEVVKMAFTLDPPLFELLERELERLLAADPEALATVVEAAVLAKAGVVEEDPEEAGRRQVLNFGHTLGHAIEACLGYSGLRHGEAVAWGLRFATRLALDRGLPAGDAERLERLLDRLELPALPVLELPEVVAAMGRDKKARESGLAWVLPRRLGAAELDIVLPAQSVEAALADFLAEAGRRQRA